MAGSRNDRAIYASKYLVLLEGWGTSWCLVHIDGTTGYINRLLLARQNALFLNKRGRIRSIGAIEVISPPYAT